MKHARAGKVITAWWGLLLPVCLLMLLTAANFKGKREPKSQSGQHSSIRSRPILGKGHQGAAELVDSAKSLVASDSSSSSRGSTNSSSSRGMPFLPPMPAKRDCPAWIAEYAKFHRANRGKPGAKYLVYTACPGFSGLGDRIRGMMYLTRQAAALGRVVLFTWRNEPHELQRYMPPAGPIDWTLDGLQDYDYPNIIAVCPKNKNVSFYPKEYLHGVLPDGSPARSSSSSAEGAASFHSLAFRASDYRKADLNARMFVMTGGLRKLDKYKFLTIHTNIRPEAKCYGCPPLAEPAPWPARDGKGQRDVSAACLFRALFTLSPEVEAAANTELLRLFGSQAQQPGFQYVSIHMRLGGMEQEKSLNSNKGGGNGPLLDLIQGVTCMRKKGQEVGVDTRKAPVILFTDHPQLRNFVKTGGMTDVVTTNVKPTHLGRMAGDEAGDADAAMSTYVDFAQLARSRCAIYSTSGLSMSAWMMGGGTDCYEHLKKGLESCAASLMTS